MNWWRSDVSISFCMIVRDGATTLPQCLESVRPLVDELIVVDTGSVDNSCEIARSYGAHVVSFPWCDDFAAARNAYLALAKHKWILSLDADETIRTDKHALTSLLTNNPKTAFLCDIKTYFSLADWQGPLVPSKYGGEVEPGIGWIKTSTVRLFQRKEGLRYQFPVHESLLPGIKRLGMRIRKCDLPIQHSGLIEAGQQQQAAKRNYYRKLGLRKIAQYPRYFMGYLEMGLLFYSEGELKQAEEMFHRCLRLNPFCERAHVYLSLAARAMGRPSQAVERARKALRIFPRNRDLLYALGLAELDTGNTVAAMTSLAPALARIPQPSNPFHEVIPKP